MPHLLVIAHAFPPVAGVGVQRTLSFVRYLPRFAWQPVVLTVREPIDVEMDGALLTRIPSEAVVARTYWLHPRLVIRQLHRRLSPSASPEPRIERLTAAVPPARQTSRWRVWLRAALLIPDQAIGWLPFAVWRGMRLMREHEIAALYSTSGPPTCHLVGWMLKRLTRRPWVADFRDPWTADLSTTRREIYRVAWRRRVDAWLERRVLAAADAVVAVSAPQRDVLLAAAGVGPAGEHTGGTGERPGQPKGRPPAADTCAARFHVITNGFDPDLTAGIQRQPPPVFTLTYTGTFYLAEQSPAPLFEAVARLLGEGGVDAADFRIRIIGASGERVAGEVARYGLERVVAVLPALPHREVLQAQADASALLLVLGPSQGRQGVLTGKLFEYLAARRPILGLVPPDSAAADVLRDTGAGSVVDPADVAGIAAAVRSLYDEFRASGDVAWHGREDAVWTFARPRLAGQLAAILDRLVGRSASAAGGPIGATAGDAL